MLNHIQLWLPRILTLALWLCAIGIAYSVATTALAIFSGPTAAQFNQPQPGAPSTSVPLPPPPSINELSKRALFGQVRTNTGQTPDTRAPATPTRLPLTLEAIFVSSDPAQSGAIISQRGKPSKLYGPGDTVPGNARLVAVEADRVILRRAGVREALAFKTGYKVNPNPPGSTANASVELLSPQSVENANDRPVLEALGADLAQRPEETLSELGIAAHASGGYRIGNQSNPYLSQSGLQPGDIILSLNGRPLGDLSVDRLAIADLAAAESVRLEIMRNGQTLTITSRIPESLRR